MIISVFGQLVVLRCAEVGQTSPGVPRGQSPDGKFSGSEKPKGFIGEAVPVGLSAGDTCLITRRRFRSLGGRRRGISGLAICPEG